MRIIPGRALHIALAVSDSPRVDFVSRIFGDSGGRFIIAQISSLDPLIKPGSPLTIDLLLLDLAFSNARAWLSAREDGCPILLLVNADEEAEALTLLQSERIADYLLWDESQLKRLPFTVERAIIRYEAQGQNGKRNQTQVLQEAIYQIAEAAVMTASLEDLLPEIHRIISQVMPAENFYIALYDPLQETLSFPYFVDEQETLTETTLPLGRGLTEFVLRSGKSLLCADKSQEQLALSGEVDAVGPPSAIWLGVPLIVDGAAIGVMVVQHYRNSTAYGEVEQRMLEFVSSQVAMVIHRKRMVDALRASETSFRGVFENATVGLGRTTPDGHILLANPAMVHMLGFESLEDLKRRNLSKEGYVDQHSREEFLNRMERDGEVQGLESAWVRVDGSVIYVRESSWAVRDEEGRILYFESVVENVTDRRRAEIALQDKVVALQSLAEIDREILAANDSQSILDLVCRRIAELIKAPKSAIVAMEKSNRRFVTAFHGFANGENLRSEFSTAVHDGMLEHWQSYVVNDVSRERTRYMPFLRANENLHALVVEPFQLSSSVLGALVVFDTSPRQWSEDDIQLVRLLAGQAALALEKMRLLTEARRRADEVSSLYQVAVEIMSRRDLNTVLEMIVDKAASFYQVSNAFIYLYDEALQEVELSVVSNPEMMLGVRLKLGEGMAGKVASTLQPMTLEDYSQWDGRAHVYDNRHVLAVLEVPMLYGGHLIGILGIESLDSSRTFDDADQLSLSLLAEQAASAIYNARLFSEIEDRNRELNRLSHASATLLAGVSSDIPHLCRDIATLLASEFHNSHCSIWLIKDDDLSLERAGVSGPYVDVIRAALLTTKGPGLIAKAIRTRAFINVGDVRGYEDYIEGWEDAASELVVPLRSGDRILGAIDLQNQSLNAYSDDDIRLIELIASQAALMVEHVRLYQQTDHRLHQLTVLSNIDAAIASSLDLRVTLNILVSQISTHLETDAVDVMLLNNHLRLLEFAAGRGFRGNAIRRGSLLLGEDPAGIAALERTVVSIFDLSTHMDLQHPERIAGEDFVSMYAVPLVAKGQIKGVLELFYRRPVESDPDWIHFLEILARQAAVAVEDASLFNDMQRSFTELAVAYDAAIEGWARVLQMRHHEPEELLQMLSNLTLELARRMGIPESEMTHVYRGVLLHDIGKLDISEKILFKPGPLTFEERDIINHHPAYAYDFLQSIAYLRSAMNIPYCHHERWDGSGYPRGLKGEAIPLEARIFSVVKVWTALQYERPFRPAWTRAEATAYVTDKAGQEFDPHVVTEFLQMLKDQGEV